MIEYNQRKEMLKMKQKEYKFLAKITYNDGKEELNTFIDYTASARARAKKVAKRPDVHTVNLYRINKTEEFI